MSDIENKEVQDEVNGELDDEQLDEVAGGLTSAGIVPRVHVLPKSTPKIQPRIQPGGVIHPPVTSPSPSPKTYTK